MNNANIDSVISNNMKPLYFYNKILNYCEIIYGSKKYIVDIEDAFIIINCDKKFNFYHETDLYPSYKINYRKISYLDFIYNVNSEKNSYEFHNGNCMDLTRKNIVIKPTEELINCKDIYLKNIEIFVKSKYDNVALLSEGHCIKLGRQANKIKNPIWKTIDSNKEILLMYCGPESLCLLCPDGYKKILEYEEKENGDKKITFCKNSGGYVTGSNNIYIHQILTGCYGNGKGTKNISVDHIDQNPLNNCLNNLRIATRAEQEQNSKGIAVGTKRARKHSDKPLPKGITQDMMGKYVNYYHEFVDKEQTKSREFFKIEKNPKLAKIWTGTKSNKIPILEKLATVNKVAADLENNIYPIDQ
jgi:hypothetical protein